LKKLLWFTSVVLLIGIASACSKDEPASSSAISGEDVFQQSCITCHSSGDITGGQAKLDSAKIHADFKDKASLQEFVSKNMPKSAPGSLKAEEYEAVVEYLWNQEK
jgi:mono/diheme cytochrome c family protein